MHAPGSQSSEPELQINPARSPRPPSIPFVIPQVTSIPPQRSQGQKLPRPILVLRDPQPLPLPPALAQLPPCPMSTGAPPGFGIRPPCLFCPCRRLACALQLPSRKLPGRLRSRAPPPAREGVRNRIPPRITRRHRHARPAWAARKPRERTRAAAGGPGLRDPPAPSSTHFVLGAQVLQGGAAVHFTTRGPQSR
ncbi:WAS/WASL-interacting protein family member 1-like [Mus musculus]|uniref:WAS/WASL-interacting protein family member 1-like n=1 Tax=Mus musculus TaxID=10090 RepID=UPI0016778570|nr:WAS/WASL-interacting protein family member 1-like [Mus musculus]